MNKRKIVNDPVYGFIKIPNDLVFDIIEHPYFQRLRRIMQLGLTYLVYPGATHNRFQHVLGATYLMYRALEELKFKGITITEEEQEATLIAILLHDIGHAPFSHTLEKIFINELHENISIEFMNILNKNFGNKLELGINIFMNNYKKKFLHQLISSQLDMDRLDYLRRDSFYTGVSEGVVGSDRIIKMLNVCNNELVVESKGIYSVEKFLIARRLMYWQVYLHKTVISGEQMLIKILKRAKYLAGKGEEIYCTSALKYFLYKKVDFNINNKKTEILERYALLDDFDIITSIKEWCCDKDFVLSFLSRSLINRKLFKVEIYNNKNDIDHEKIKKRKQKIQEKYNLSDKEVNFIVFSDKVSNRAYSPEYNKINILNNKKIVDIAEASDISIVSSLSSKVEKVFICYPRIN